MDTICIYPLFVFATEHVIDILYCFKTCHIETNYMLNIELKYANINSESSLGKQLTRTQAGFF